MEDSSLKEIDTSQNYWPWLLIAIPFAAVLFGILMVTTTLMYPDDVVIDNYYKDGMAINKRISMDELAFSESISAELVQLDQISIGFDVKNTTDSAIQLKLYHVTDKSQDLIFTLAREGGANADRFVSYEPVDVLGLDGVWYIELLGSETKWRLRGRIQTPIEMQKIVLKPELHKADAEGE